MTGRIVSHFEITEKIGEGGCGVVWKARDLNLPRFVALKFLPPHLGGSEDGRRRLRREAEAISVLSHPHIETIYEVGEWDGQLFLALEFLPGGSWDERLHSAHEANRLLALPEVIGCALQVAEGLVHAHRHAIIHRDIKPANILCTTEGSAKVTDFGLAQFLDSTASRTAGLAGTISYMSPEQIQGLPVDHRTDIYSFGVMLFEMVTGQRPFRGPNNAAVLHAIVHSPAPSLRALRPDASGELDEVVRRAMAKAREERYQQMEQVAAALRRLPAPSLPRSGTQETLSLPPAAGGIRTQRPVFRRAARPAVLVAASMLILSGVAGRLWLWPQRCMLTPGWFGACRLPGVEHLGVLPFQNLSGGASDSALFTGLEQVVTAELTHLGRYENTLCVHRIQRPAEAPGFNLLLRGTTTHAGDSLLLTMTLSNPGTGLELRRRRVSGSRRQLTSLPEDLLRELAAMTGVPPPTELKPSQTKYRAAFESYLKGRGYLGQGKLEEAIGSFKSALEDDDAYTAAFGGLGEAYLRKYERVRDPKWLELALKACDRAIRAESPPAAAYESLGRIHLETGRYDKAAEAFRSCLALDPMNIDRRRLLARTYELQERLDEAERVYKEGISRRPYCSAALNSLGGFFINQHRFGQARESLLAAQKLGPGDPRVLNNLGALSLATDEFEKAAEFSEQSLAIDLLDAAANNLGASYFFLGCYADSARAFEKAISLGVRRESRFYGGYGEVLLKVAGRGKEARALFEKAISLGEQELAQDSTNVGVLRMLANDYARLGDFDKALKTMGRALKLAPKDVEVQFRAGLVYELAGQRKPALEALRAAQRGGFSARKICTNADLAVLRRDPQFVQVLPDRCQSIPPADPKACPTNGRAR